jgi:hypothetical protein
MQDPEIKPYYCQKAKLSKKPKTKTKQKLKTKSSQRPEKIKVTCDPG